jgi:HrpA-like RNA helicase
VIGALEQLYSLDALNEKGVITETGKRMSRFPVSPHFAKVLLMSKSFNCVAQVISIISMLSVEPIFYIPNDKRDEAVHKKKKFMHYDGDLITLLNVMNLYKQGGKAFCKEHFVSERSMRQVCDIRKQLEDLCVQNDIPITSSDNIEDIQKSFLSGFFKNVAILQQDGTYQTLQRQKVWVHPSSVLFQQKAPAVMYVEFLETTKNYIRNVTVVHASWMSEVAPKYFARNSLSNKTNL